MLTNETTQLDSLARKVKADFPFFTANPETIYLDSAATSLKPQTVIDAIVRYYEQFSANIHRGVYRVSMEATEVYESTREVIKNFLGANDDYEVIYVRNTTEAMNLLAVSLSRTTNQLKKNYSAWQNGFEKGDVILLTESEHHSNIVPWQMIADAASLELVYVPVMPNGELSREAFQDIKIQLKNRRVKIVSISQVSNVTGIIHNLDPFIAFAREKGALFFVDGAQAVCHQTISLKDSGADAFVFSAHKLLGPTGTGVLVGRKSLLENLPPFLGGGDMILEVSKNVTTYNKIPHKFEAGTPDIAGVYGLRAAIEYLNRIGMDTILNWEKELVKYGMQKLEAAGVHVFGPSLSELERVEKVGVISFNIPGIHPHDVGTIMDEHNVCIRAGHHCCQLLMQAWNTSATNRASFYLYNDYSDIDKLAEAVGYVKKIFNR